MNIQRKSEEAYVAPVAVEILLCSEGVLCHSKDSEGYGGGSEFDWEDEF